MAKIIPFAALHPAKGLYERVAALPYDVYNRKEARVEALKDPLSFLNIDRPETQFPEDADMYAPSVYEKAASMLREQTEQGVYTADQTPCYYIYELVMDGRSQTGVVACASIDDYENGVILKHENTRPEKELDRIRHVDTVNAQTGPIFLAYRKNEQIAEVVSQTKMQVPDFDFVSADGITHRGWTVSAPEDIRVLREAFAGIRQIYIADGHHRAASAVRVGLKRREENPGWTGDEPWNSFLCVLFPDDELKILDYNRVIKDPNGLTEERFLEKIAAVAAVEKKDGPVRPQRKGQTGMYLPSGWYLLTFRQEVMSSDPVEGLDVSVLQKEILGPVLGIGDPRVDHRIDFVGGIRGLQELERRVKEDCAVAFSMFPTSIHELFDVADAHRLMPPKSTWFEPKLRSGLFIHRI